MQKKPPANMPSRNAEREKTLRSRARWMPQPKQEEALCRPEFEIGFGGARGGGKTDAGIGWLGYDSETKLRGLVVRKNSTDLGDWLIRAKEIHPKLKITGNPAILRFPDKNGVVASGATFFTGHMKDKDSLSKYVGQNLQRILIEELNLIPSEDQYKKLLASCRSPIPGVAAQIFSTFNPDNVGHTWIKKRFRLKGIPTKPVITQDEDTGRMRIFVPARIEDNRILTENDPEYIKTLDGLGQGLREQWRWGSWNDPVIKGAYYSNEIAQMRRTKRITSLPFYPELSVHTWWDIGNDMTAILFVQFVDDWVHVIDFYANDSLGFPFYLAKLQELRENKGYNYGIHHFPHDLNRMEWGTGRERKEVLEARNIDYEIVTRPKSKLGAIEVTRLLFPRMKIDKNNCAQFVDALINYRKLWIEDLQTFKDEPVHDWASHPADALSYVALSNFEALKPETSSELPPSRVKRADLGSADPSDGLKPQRRPSAEFGGGRLGGDAPTSSRFQY